MHCFLAEALSQGTKNDWLALRFCFFSNPSPYSESSLQGGIALEQQDCTRDSQKNSSWHQHKIPLPFQTRAAHLQQWDRKSIVNLLSSKSAPSPAASAVGAEEPTSTSIAADRLRLAPASPPLGEPVGAATVARVEGERTRYPSRDPLAPLGLPCCDPGRGGSSLRDDGLRFLAGKYCGGGQIAGRVRAWRQGGECGQELGLGFYLVDLGARGARRHCGSEGEGRFQFRLKWAAEAEAEGEGEGRGHLSSLAGPAFTFENRQTGNPNREMPDRVKTRGITDLTIIPRNLVAHRI